MSYYFECDTCGNIEPTSPEELSMTKYHDLHMNCGDCGQDGCRKCLVGDRCDNCWRRYANSFDDDDLDKPDGSV